METIRQLNMCKRDPIVDGKSSQMLGVPPRAPHFSVRDWIETGSSRICYSENQQKSADKIIAEADKLIEDSCETVLSNKKETEHRLQVKVQDIEYLKTQLEIQKKEVDLELEAMQAYKDRINNSQLALGTKAKEIVKKCILLREGRLGTDLCVDQVEIELSREIQLLDSVQVMYSRLSEQVHEQMRRLRAMNYSICKDILEKEKVLKLDNHNIRLKESDLGLSVYQGSAVLDPADVPQDEWLASCQHNIDVAHAELASGRPLRGYVDTLLKQIVEDLWKQYDLVNAAFKHRVRQHKDAKTKLENQHFEVVRQANEITMTVTKLNKALAEKEPFMALAHTRLGNRCQRSGIESCKDEVERYLVNEVVGIREEVTKLQNMLAESRACLRYLLRTQVQIEEDINIKTNSIKIDEVDCLTLRQGIDYHAY